MQSLHLNCSSLSLKKQRKLGALSYDAAGGGGEELPARRTKIPYPMLQVGLFGSMSIILGWESNGYRVGYSSCHFLCIASRRNCSKQDEKRRAGTSPEDTQGGEAQQLGLDATKTWPTHIRWKLGMPQRFGTRALISHSAYFLHHLLVNCWKDNE